MNTAIVYFDEIAEFSGFQSLQALFIKQFKIRVKKLLNSQVELCIYNLDNKFLKSLVVNQDPLDLAMKRVIKELEYLATNQP